MISNEQYIKEEFKELIDEIYIDFENDEYTGIDSRYLHLFNRATDSEMTEIKDAFNIIKEKLHIIFKIQNDCYSR